MSKKLTITLTDQRPVTINTEVWPIVAQAKDWDNQYECQANRTWKLIVRQCQKEGDDRCIVYGIHTSQWASENDRRGGQIIDSIDDAPTAIKEVAEYLNFDLTLADDCIADLPAIEL